MMMIRLVPLTLLLAMGCGSDKSDDDDSGVGLTTGGGTTSGGTTAGATTGTTTGTTSGSTTGGVNTIAVDVLGLNQGCGADPGIPETLALVETMGAIDVVHEAITAPQTADWEVDAVAYPDEFRVVVTYSNVGTQPYTGDCWWTLDYILDGLSAGTWTVEAGSVSGEVTL